MRNNRDLFTLLEFGTEKICVLIGASVNGRAEVLHFVQKDSNGAIVKGEIEDYEKVKEILQSQLKETKLPEPLSPNLGKVFCLLNGGNIQSEEGKGIVEIDGSDKKITALHIQKAIEKAQNITLKRNQYVIGLYDSFFVLDDVKKVFHPENETANQMEAHLHVITTSQKQVDTINRILRELNFEKDMIPVFSGVASIFGVLTRDERENGAVLIDFGAGCCNYIVVHHDGICFSGVLTVGTNHIANDLAIGLNLPYAFCKRFLRETKSDDDLSSGFVEYQSPGTAVKRKIPRESFEKIIEARLTETFEIIKKEISARKLLNLSNAIVVISGGGQDICGVDSALSDVFQIPFRKGKVIDITSSTSQYRDSSSAYVAILGLLKYAIENSEDEKISPINGVINWMTGFAGKFFGGKKDE